MNLKYKKKGKKMKIKKFFSNLYKNLRLIIMAFIVISVLLFSLFPPKRVKFLEGYKEALKTCNSTGHMVNEYLDELEKKFELNYQSGYDYGLESCNEYNLIREQEQDIIFEKNQQRKNSKFKYVSISGKTGYAESCGLEQGTLLCYAENKTIQVESFEDNNES